MYVRLSVCASSFLTYKRRPLHIKQFPNRTPPPPPGYLGYEHFKPGNVRNQGHVSKRHNDVIASGAHRVYDVSIIIFFISCRWVTQRGYPAVLCKNSVPFCLFTTTHVLTSSGIKLSFYYESISIRLDLYTHTGVCSIFNFVVFYV